MKLLKLSLTMALMTAGPVLAQDVAGQAPVDPAATQAAPVQTAPESAPAAPAVQEPDRRGPRDAITGQRVDNGKDGARAAERELSLRDKVRSQMRD